MNVEGGSVDIEIGKDSASMKVNSKESRNDKTLLVFVSSLLLVSCLFKYRTIQIRASYVKLHVSAIILKSHEEALI